MCVGVGRAVPVEVVAARTPARPVVLPDGDLEILRAVLPFHISVSATDGQLPANVGLGLDDADPAIQRQLVQRATCATLEVGPVQEDARPFDDASLAAPLFILLGELLGSVVLPLLGTEFCRPFLDALLVVFVREMGAQRAAPVARTIGVDPLATGTEDAGPIAGEPREIAAEDLFGIDRVGELQEGSRKVEIHLRHAFSVSRVDRSSVTAMRLGVLDVGSNTVHLLVVDAHHGAAPRSAYSYKTELRLAEFLEADGAIAEPGADSLVAFVAEAATVAERIGAEEMLAFATSAIREAPNGDAVLERVQAETGVDLQVLAGADEARLTFLAVRRWFGWSSGRLLVLDIGGGSLEVAIGVTEEPDDAFSLPLGAGRLTREYFTGDPPDPAEIKRVRKLARGQIADQWQVLPHVGDISQAVGTSKTFKQLARLGGAEPSSAGAYAPRSLTLKQLNSWVPRLAKMPSHRRSDLPGISEGRAHQILAGALVAEAVMETLGLDSVEICPWALREGVILRRLDWMGR